MEKPNKQDKCETCGHFYFLHDRFNGECDACDSPEIPLEKKCPGFKKKEST